MTSLGLRKPYAIDIACAVLVIAGALRLFALVLHAPLLGYANQYDMVRSSACVDLWPALPRPLRYAAHQSAPIAHYEIEHLAGGPCYLSSVLIFVEAAKGGVALLRRFGLVRDADFPLQAVGATEAFALLALVLAFITAERHRPRARLAHAVVFAIVLSDPALSVWMNTLYTEFGATFFLYAVGGLLALAPERQHRIGSTAAWMTALAGLALSRQQYAMFAAVPLVIAAPQAWRRARGAWIACVIAVGVSVGIQSSSVAKLPALRAANNHDFYLGAALPAVRDEVRALARLGLPAACGEAVGSNWYVGMGADPQRECGEVESLGRLAFLKLIPEDPALPARILVRGLPLAQTWWQHYLGMVADASFGDLSRMSGPLMWSLADVTERLSLMAFLGVLAALAAGFVATGAAWLGDAACGRPGDGCVRAMFYASAAGVYAPVSAIFGDGYVEVSRHAIVLHPALVTLALLAAGRAIAPLAGTQGTDLPVAGRGTILFGRHFAPWNRNAARIATAWIAGTALLGAGLVLSARTWPLSQGVVGMPTARKLDGDTYSVRGWAIDPFGVRDVRVAAYPDFDTRVPQRVWTATTDRAVHGPLGELLAIYYPTFPGVDRGGFAIDLQRSTWPIDAPCLRTFVTNRLGVTTEIDRRCVMR